VPFKLVRAGGSSLRVILATRNVNVVFLPAPPKDSIVVLPQRHIDRPAAFFSGSGNVAFGLTSPLQQRERRRRVGHPNREEGVREGLRQDNPAGTCSGGSR
jgi:hypothetical protein